MTGISPRYMQDKISNALVGAPEAMDTINPFMVHERARETGSGTTRSSTTRSSASTTASCSAS